MTTNEDDKNVPTEEKEEKEEKQQKDERIEILREDYPNYDLSFKIIVIGNSGKKNKYILIINNRCWKIMLINYGYKKKF